ncbi:hypothetical protein J7J39_02465 [bacterium]|nr:hypothetical protein [bacterium]
MQSQHPAFLIKGKKSKSLLGKKIVLGITGSLAAVKTVEMARELIREGADVYPVMTKAATRIIHPSSVHLACGREVITKLTGKVEYIQFFGGKDKADLFLIAPCTANTVGKIASGIGDTTVTIFAMMAFSSKCPVLIVPAMHQGLYENPIFQENLKKLEKLGAVILQPKIEEGKAKIPDIKEIVQTVKKLVSKN